MACWGMMPRWRAVTAMVLRVAQAFAPRSLREQWLTFRAMTAGRRARSALLLVGSTAAPQRQCPLEDVAQPNGHGHGCCRLAGHGGVE
ncbi:MAG: hypothetical protein WCK89_20795 [bacterium]